MATILPGLAAYPDIHPMLVHLPIGLFPIALLLAAAAWRRAWSHLASPARLLLVLGALGALAAVATGLAAQEAVPHGRGTLVAAHRGYMLAATAIALLLSAWSLSRRGPLAGRSLRVLLAGLIVLNGVLVLGADRGALVALRLRAGLDLALPAGAAPPAPPPHASAAGDSLRGGRLYQRLGCGACHDPGARAEVPGTPPSLASAGSKLQTEWVRSYLREPYRIRWADENVRPTVRMPDFELAADEANDLAAQLATRRDPQRFPAAPVESPPLTEAEARAGRDRIDQYACKGCHSLGGTGNTVGPALDGVGSRLRPAWIYAFLLDPRAIIPGTPMKKFDFWPNEARGLTAYLMTLQASSPAGGAPLPR